MKEILKGCAWGVAGLFVLVLVALFVIAVCVGPSEDGEITEEVTPTEATCPTLEEASYFLLVGDIVNDMAMSDFVRLTGEASENPLVSILDDNWKLEMAATLVSMQSSADRLRDLESPSPAADAIHQNNLATAQVIEEFVQLYLHGVDNLDVDSLNAANQKMERLGGLAEAVAGMMESFCE